MALEQKPRITEIQVRVDCNGCVQKIKKALHGIKGICDYYIDYPQQKLTIIGWADPEKILKAIKKTRKTATLCSHGEVPVPDPAAEPTDQPPAPGGPNSPPPECPPSETGPPAEPPKDPSPPPENPAPEVTPSPVAADTSGNQPMPPSGPKDVGEIHVIYHHPPEYAYRYAYGHNYGASWNNHPNVQQSPQESSSGHHPPSVTDYGSHRYGYGHNYGAQGNNHPNVQAITQEAPPNRPPISVTHSYNTYKPTPNVTEYGFIQSPAPISVTYQPSSPHVTQYEYIQPPQRAPFNENHHIYNYNNNNNNGNITSMFSDENPNACRIV